MEVPSMNVAQSRTKEEKRMTLNWFSIAWIAVTVLVILYALRRMIDRAERRQQAKDSLDAALMFDRLAQINQPELVRRNEALRREWKIW